MWRQAGRVGGWLVAAAAGVRSAARFAVGVVLLHAFLQALLQALVQALVSFPPQAATTLPPTPPMQA